MTNVRTMTVEELLKMSCPVTAHTMCIQNAAFDELARRAGLLDRLEVATDDRWYFNLVRTPDGTWVAQFGAATEVERPTAREAIEKALEAKPVQDDSSYAERIAAARKAEWFKPTDGSEEAHDA